MPPTRRVACDWAPEVCERPSADAFSRSANSSRRFQQFPCYFRSECVTDDSCRQRDESRATGHLKFAKDRVQMLFHGRQTQAGVFSNFLVTSDLSALLTTHAANATSRVRLGT